MPQCADDIYIQEECFSKGDNSKIHFLGFDPVRPRKSKLGKDGDLF